MRPIPSRVSLFQKLTLASILSAAINSNAAAFAVRYDVDVASGNDTGARSSAIPCAGCTPTPPQSALFRYLSQLPQVRQGDAQVHGAAIFGSDNRQLVNDLRQKNSRDLTIEEKAILQAAGRTGILACPDGSSSNATVIRLPDDTSDHIITSAHAFVQNGLPYCDLAQVIYFPNTGYYYGAEQSNVDFVRTRVFTDGHPPLTGC